MEGQTSYEQQLKQAHLARRARIAARAVPDKPIECLSASERMARLAKAASAAKTVPAIPKEWIERQIKIHKQYVPWFRIVSDTEGPRPSLSFIREVCSRKYGIPVADIISDRRDAKTTFARHVALYFAKKLTTWSYPEIGRRFGGRDHTTIIHAMRKIQRLIAEDERFAEEISQLEAKLINSTVDQVSRATFTEARNEPATADRPASSRTRQDQTEV